MEFCDHYYHSRYSGPSGILRMLGNESGRPRISAPPSYYIKRQVKCTFMYDPAAILLRELTGVDCLMWGNDYPHIEGIYPDSQALVEKQFAGVPEADVQAIVRDNAAALYGLRVSV
jgi:predicted TIM-barrel fold metal-dependent hydrolase